MNEYFLILYQGLKPKTYYWEFVNTARKVILVIVLMLPGLLKALLSTVIIFTTIRIQIYLRPYRDEDHNKLELLAMVSGLVTVMSSLIFTEENNVSFIEIATVLLIIGINAIFLMEWIYKMAQCMQNKNKVFKKVKQIFIDI